MNSKLKEAIKLTVQPIAVFRAETMPDGALQFKEGRWACVAAALAAVAQGKTAAFCDKTTVCLGGKAGLALKKMQLGMIEYFLSTGGVDQQPAEYYKKSPELARQYISQMPVIENENYLIMKPLNELCASEKPEVIVFLVNADQLSALATLANFDTQTQDNVKLNFGSGCSQAILLALDASEKGENTCFVGLTDPSARLYIDKDLLSFSIPYERFLKMENEADNSFLKTESWQKIFQRI